MNPSGTPGGAPTGDHRSKSPPKLCFLNPGSIPTTSPSSLPSPLPPCPEPLPDACHHRLAPHLSRSCLDLLQSGLEPSQAALVQSISWGSASSRSWPPPGPAYLATKACLCCWREGGHRAASTSPKANGDPRCHSFQPRHAASGASVQITTSTYHSDLPVRNSSYGLEVGMRMMLHPD